MPSIPGDSVGIPTTRGSGVCVEVGVFVGVCVGVFVAVLVGVGVGATIARSTGPEFRAETGFRIKLTARMPDVPGDPRRLADAAGQNRLCPSPVSTDPFVYPSRYIDSM
jgi:hypothetical protein